MVLRGWRPIATVVVAVMILIVPVSAGAEAYPAIANGCDTDGHTANVIIVAGKVLGVATARLSRPATLI
jgi:hypothetical protein